MTHHDYYYADDHRIGDVGDTPDEIQRVSYAEQLANTGLHGRGATGRTYERYKGQHWVSDYPDMTPGDMLWSEASGHWEQDYASTADFDQNYEPINDTRLSSCACTTRLPVEALTVTRCPARPRAALPSSPAPPNTSLELLTKPAPKPVTTETIARSLQR